MVGSVRQGQGEHSLPKLTHLGTPETRSPRSDVRKN